MLNRRDFLRLGGALTASALTLASPCPQVLAEVTAGRGPYGPLGPPDENGIQLPRGFRSRLIAQSREPVPGTDFLWHVFPDGGATFPLRDGGWVYVSNCEFVVGGGASAIRFTPAGSQRGGPEGYAVTYEIQGPFHARRAGPKGRF